MLHDIMLTINVKCFSCLLTHVCTCTRKHVKMHMETCMYTCLRLVSGNIQLERAAEGLLTLENNLHRKKMFTVRVVVIVITVQVISDELTVPQYG